MKKLAIIIVFAMFGCTKDKGIQMSEAITTAPVSSRTLICDELITKVAKLNGKTTTEVASKMVEFAGPDQNAFDKMINCLDESLKIECYQGKCLVEKKDI